MHRLQLAHAHLQGGALHPGTQQRGVNEPRHLTGRATAQVRLVLLDDDERGMKLRRCGGQRLELGVLAVAGVTEQRAAGLQAEAARKVGSFYPLTMPLTVGPGSMSVAITIGSRKPPACCSV